MPALCPHKGFAQGCRLTSVFKAERANPFASSRRSTGEPRKSRPTLGLVQDASAGCGGVAFEFSDARREQVLSYLREREGPSFSFPNVRVRLGHGRRGWQQA